MGLSLTICVGAAPANAQARFYYPAPPASAFTVSPNISFATVDTTTLRLDVYRPATAAARSPVLVFYTAPTQRANGGYIAWAKLAASRGIVAVLADLRATNGHEDFARLLTYLQQQGASYGIDTSAIAVFGASSNGFAVFSYAENPRETRIRGAVVYYAGTDAPQFRRDLPVLYVRAGIERPMVRASIDSTVARALLQNAPITIVNYSGGHHGFETTDDNLITRELIDQTIDFVKRVTTPAYRVALTSTLGYANAMAHVATGNFTEAVAEYADLVAKSPDNAPLRLSYGEALLAARRYAEACAEFEKLKGKGLGPRDLGLPAASACLQKGDPEAAMAWLKSIPSQFLPIRVRDDPAYAALKARTDFQALFNR